MSVMLLKLFALVIIAYTAVMLLIHVSTGWILEAWAGSPSPAGSWIQRRFHPRRALRVEALYWALLSLAAWSFWPSLNWKVVVAVFAAIHLAVWLAGELHAIRLGGDASLEKNRKANRAIIAFDLVEAAALIAMAWLTALYLLQPLHPP